MKKIVFGIVMSFISLASWSQDQVNISKAETTFKSYCSGCHGIQMQAFVDRKWKFGNSQDSIIASITKGRADAGMPAFGEAFTSKEIADLAAFIESGIQNVNKYSFAKKELPSIFQAEKFQYRLDTVFSGLDVPWGMAFLPDGQMLITERSGVIYLLDKNKKATKVKNVPEVLAEGQGGLMDVVLHPDFKKNQWIYLSYSAFKKDGAKKLSTTVVERARLNGAALEDRKLIFEALPYSTTRHHYGSRMAFDGDGYLYITVGDRGNHDENPQSLDNNCGKVNRLNDDGSIPKDNPFVNVANALPAIYSYGHRNPQGLAIHPSSGKLWSHEHGPRGGDEINIVEPGVNYGWPVISYGLNYNGTVLTNLQEKEGMEQPLHYWVPSIAPCGMAFVTSDKYPGWENQLLVGSLRFEYLNLCFLEGEKVTREEMLLENIGRVRNVAVSPDGYIYVAVERPGFVFRLVPIK
jgi:aldose sugar dehydrogenase